MSALWTSFKPDTRKHVDLQSAQIALLLALEPFLQAAGLWIVCADCAQHLGTYKHLVTQNGPQDEIWKMDCPCTTRQFPRANLEHTMHPSGDLFLVADHLLKGTGLAIRCPTKTTKCLTTPLTITATDDGVEMRCQCWQIALGHGVYRIRKRKAAVPA